MKQRLINFINKRSTVVLQVALALLVGYLIFTVVSLTETIRQEQREHRQQAESTLGHLETIVEADKKNTENHRKRNEAVHDELRQYIRCVVLLPREQRENPEALDKCGKESVIPPQESEPKPEPQPEPQPQTQTQPELQPTANPQTPAPTKPQTEAQPEAKPEPLQPDPSPPPKSLPEQLIEMLRRLPVIGGWFDKGVQ